MWVYVARRILSGVPILFGVALVVFVVFHLLGGDPVYQMVGKHANEQQIAALRHEYGFDQPKSVQFLEYLKQIVTFDYGRSFATRQPIRQMVLDGIGPSLTLAVPAFFFTTVFSILAALLMVFFNGRWPDRVGVVLCVLGMSIPMLAYILFGQYFFAHKLGWFPVFGFETGWLERFRTIALPAVIWVIVSVGYDVRFYRTALIEELRQDYVRTARAKGLGEFSIFLKHILKNGMLPVLTNIVVQIPLLVLGSFLLEKFFGIPGLGNMTIDALRNSDFPVIKAMTTLCALLMIFGNLVTDILYTVFDPRVRLS